MTAITPEKRFAIHRAVNIDGLTYNQAAKFFSVKPDEVKKICEEVSRENEDRFATRTEYQREIQGEKIEEIYRIMRRKLQESEKPTRKKFTDTITRKKKTEGGEEYDEVVGTKTRVVIEQNRADPRWANGALAAISEYSDTFGLKVPKRHEHAVHSIHEVYISSIAGKSREELEQIASVEMLRQSGVLKLTDEQPRPVASVVVEKKEEVKSDLPF